MKFPFVSLILTLSLSFFSCSHGPAAGGRHPSGLGAGSLKDGELWSHDDPALKTGTLTVWDLQKMAEAGQTEKLSVLFNGGVSLDRLPQGYAAGTGARVLGLPANLATITAGLDKITGANWRGKIFFRGSATKSKGLNRIKEWLSRGKAEIVPMGAFTTELVNGHAYVPEAGSNMVLLNYAHPKTKPYWQEVVLTQIQVYDLMVAVPGKYGPVYIGKTWLGRYDSKTGEFSTRWQDHLIAWFFLDFNEEALAEQRASHWESGNVEKPIEY